MQRISYCLKTCTAAALLVLSGVASAEPFGLFNGRSANLNRMPTLSIELGLQFGDLSDLDYEHLGVRFNYKLNPLTLIYGDLGQTTLGGVTDLDGPSYGGGVYRQIDGLFSAADFAVHASVHLANLESGTQDLEGNSILVEALFSGTESINQSGTMFFNTSLGLARSSFSANGSSDESDTEFTFSAGIVADAKSRAGQFYAGVLYLEDFSIGAGYRHFFK